MCLIKNNILFAFIAGFLFNNGRLDAVSLHAQFCGFEQKCARNGTDVKLVKDSCCHPCECEDICNEKDTCCKDKSRLNDTDVPIKQECKAAVYMQQRVPYSIPFNSYYTRTRCPDFFKDSEIRYKCENSSETSFENITPVSSENGTIVYKNKFCGICHSEKRTVGWEIIIPEATTDKCQRLAQMENVTVDFVTEYILSFCTITFKRPSNLDYKSTMCIDSSLLINKCNTTGNWEVYDSEIEYLCQHPPDPGYYLSYMESKVYDNLYCYLCNTKADLTRSVCSVTPERLIGGKLFTLINQNIWTNPDAMRSTTRCLTDQVLDTFFNFCSKLYCPQFSLPFNGKCVHYMDLSQNYQASIRLIPLKRINRSESVKNELRSQYLSIKNKLGFRKCGICYIYMFLEKDSGDEEDKELRLIYVRIAVTVTEGCKLEHIWDIFTSIQRSKRIRILLNKSEIRFLALWYEQHKILNEYQNELLLKRRFDMCLVIRPFRGSTCPRVMLTSEEYETVQKNHAKADKLLFSLNQEGNNGTIFVCFDKFYRFDERTAGGKKHASDTLAMLAIFVAGFISRLY